MSDLPIARIDRVLAGIDHSAPNTTKYRALEDYLSKATDVPAGRIYAGYVSKPGNLSVRMTQSERASGADLLVALASKECDRVSTISAAERVVSARHQPLLIIWETPAGSWTPDILIASTSDGRAASLVAKLSERLLEQVELRRIRSSAEQASLFDETSPLPAHSAQVASGAGPEATEEPTAKRAPAQPPLFVDERIKRMLRHAISGHNAIMLVGPPGTGKSSLVLEAIQQMRDEPGRYGMTIDHEVMVVTADESWTTRDLVGGQSVDDEGRLRFVPGFVLQAIKEDKWLLVDEANRADMDKIFGGLLTWLTGEQAGPITVGRVSPDDPMDITLGWTSEPRSEAVPAEDDDENSPIIRYKAGREWRLIGTYNSIDAHRVFRFGLALGRRFAQVPVAPPTPNLFEQILEDRKQSFGLPEASEADVLSRITRIYTIHFEESETKLGPALFLNLPASIAAGLAEPEAGAAYGLAPLLAESYLLCFGPWLARLSDHAKARLGERLSEPDALGDEWLWVKQQLELLG